MHILNIYIVFGMLAVTPLRATNDERQSEMESFTNGGDDFSDFSCGNLLDSIDFDDLFVGINDEDVLPDLEMDPEILAEFSLSGGEESEMTTPSVSTERFEENSAKEEVDKANNNSNSDSSTLTQAEDAGSKSSEESVAANPSHKEADKAKKSSAQSKNLQGKRKVKVTIELGFCLEFGSLSFNTSVAIHKGYIYSLAQFMDNQLLLLTYFMGYFTRILGGGWKP